MHVTGAPATLPEVGPQAVVTLAPGAIPLDEVLLGLHVQRFTGAALVGAPPEVDRLCFRGGAVVGVVPRPSVDLPLLAEVLAQQRVLPVARFGEVAGDGGLDGVEIAPRLLALGLVDAARLERAYEDQARRRLFALHDLPAEPVELLEGLDRLVHFRPVAVDVRPAIAFGMVVRASPARRAAVATRLAGRTVRLVAPYDEGRNSYGLPPAVLGALRRLGAPAGLPLGQEPALPGLSSLETAGVLLLLERMALLEVLA